MYFTQTRQLYKATTSHPPPKKGSSQFCNEIYVINGAYFFISKYTPTHPTYIKHRPFSQHDSLIHVTTLSPRYEGHWVGERSGEQLGKIWKVYKCHWSHRQQKLWQQCKEDKHVMGVGAVHVSTSGSWWIGLLGMCFVYKVHSYCNCFRVWHIYT